MIYRPTVTRRRKDGSTYTKKTSGWWGRYRDAASGRRISVNLRTRDKGAAKILLREIELKAALAASGFTDPYEAHKMKPLIEHIAEFEAALLGKGNTPEYVAMKVRRVREVRKACGFVYWTDITPADLWRFIGELRDRGVQSRTRNHYLQAFRQYSRWMRDERRAADDPLVGMKSETVDDEQEAGVFEPHELRTLLDSTESGFVRRGMTGIERRLLYELACSTGFRSGECRTLTWADVDLHGDPPTATVTAKRAKNKRRHDQPLTGSLTTLLARYKATRGGVSRTDPVLPYMPERTRIARMLRADMAAAGIDDNDCAGRPRNFHSLRHTFDTNLARAGVHPKDAMELMRHSDINLTLKRYSHVTIRDRAAAVSKLPDLSTVDQECATDVA